jgi:SPP1 family phage portal protein
MKIEEILKVEQGNPIDVKTAIDELRSRRLQPQPDISSYRNQLDPLKHDVFDKEKRKDKKVKIDKDDPEYQKPSGTDSGTDANTRIEPVARVGLAIQKLIVNRAVSFLFGNPITLSASPENDNEKAVLKGISKIMYDNKEKSFNRRVARHIMSSTEVAELWYPVPVNKTKTGNGLLSKISDAVSNLIGNKYHMNYGFKSAFKLRSAILSPLNGDKLYPYFDETGDMVAFSREYSVTDKDGKVSTYFETYTDTMHYLWNVSNEMRLVDGYPIANTLGKIPIIYGCQPQVEWADVQNLIDRLEKLMSNFSDTNDYHAAPKIFIEGKILGFAKKGESGGVLQGEPGSKASYLAWDHAPESVKLEIETLLRMIYTLTQTPDISFDAVKGIGNISGVALKLLFLDAHLKVADHQEVFDEYLQRRLNVVKAFIGKFNTSLATDADNLMVEPVITPYMVKDEAAELKIWSDANGGNAVMSQKASFQKAGLTSDPDADYEQYQSEQSAANSFTFNEPTN